MINCGHCKGLHPTVADVRRCAQGYASVARSLPTQRGRTFTEADEREMQRMEAEADRRETLDDMRNKAAKWDWEARSFGRRDLDESDVVADGDRAEFQRQMRNDEPADLRSLIREVERLMVTREIPEADWRWGKAMRNLISGQSGRVTEYALRTAIARLETYPVLGSASSTPAKASEPKAERKMVEREGLYRLSRDVVAERQTWRAGEYVQVVRNKKGNRLYAKLVTFPEAEEGERVRPILTYVSGLIYQLLDGELLPVEEAEEITRKTGWCVFGHFLTSPVSIARGMGPKCYERYPHLARNAA